jgi:hypothetical protein
MGVIISLLITWPVCSGSGHRWQEPCLLQRRSVSSSRLFIVRDRLDPIHLWMQYPQVRRRCRTILMQYVLILSFHFSFPHVVSFTWSYPASISCPFFSCICLCSYVLYINVSEWRTVYYCMISQNAFILVCKPFGCWTTVDALVGICLSFVVWIRLQCLRCFEWLSCVSVS